MMQFAGFDKSRNETVRSFPTAKRRSNAFSMAFAIWRRRQIATKGVIRALSARMDERIERRTANRGASRERRRVGA
jgi:hypothetical protein